MGFNVWTGWRRSLIIFSIMFFFMFKTNQFEGSLWLVAVRMSIFLICSSVLILSHTWWNPRRIVITTVLLSIVIIISLIMQNDLLGIYMMILLTIPAAYSFEHPGYLYYLSVLVLEMVLLLLLFGHHNYAQVFSILMLFISLALSVRARVSKQDAYRLSQLHLAELEQAHLELQQAAVTTMQHAVLDERTRIAREIHDAVGHSLTSLIVQLQALRYMIEADPSEAKRSVEEMLTVARQGLTDIRVSVHALAADRSALGITPLQALVSKMNATTRLDCTFKANSQAEEIPAETGAVLFKVLQEGMTNILKHSAATKVNVTVNVMGNECLMSIQDNGQLEEIDRIFEGFGMKNMRERIHELAGTFEVRTGQPSGLIINLKVPVVLQPKTVKERSS